MAFRGKEIFVMNKVLVLGAGAWGTTIAKIVSENVSNKVFLWTYEKRLCSLINAKNINSKYLPKVKLNKKITAINSLEEIDGDIIFIATPSQKVSEVIYKIKKKNRLFHKRKLTFVICSKGIDAKKKKFLSEIVCEAFQNSQIAVLSGPTFAMPLAKKMPAAATLATKNKKTSQLLVKLLSRPYFRIYTSSDLIGIQANGVLKNILAIAAGITEGLQLGENARAAIISRGIKEISNFVIGIGGKGKTVYGLSGLGDILLTCTSMSSRNFYFGYQLGSGKKIKSILTKSKHVTEGFDNITLVYLIAKKFKKESPIINAVYDITIRKKPINAIVKKLLLRELKQE